MKTQTLLKGLATILILMLMSVNNMEAKENKIRHSEVKANQPMENYLLELETKYAVKFDVKSTLSVAELNNPMTAIPVDIKTSENRFIAVADDLEGRLFLKFDVNRTTTVAEEEDSLNGAEFHSINTIVESIIVKSNLKFDVHQTISVREAIRDLSF